MLFLLVISFVIAMLVGLVIITRTRGSAARYEVDKPQRFHSGSVPRLGGLGLLAGVACAWLVAAVSVSLAWRFNVRVSWFTACAWLLLVLPAVLGGAYEDITQNLSVYMRLLLTASSALLACYLLDLRVSRLDIPFLDEALLAWPGLGVALAFFAICGLPHAINLIDGYNGLAAMVATLISLAITYIALLLGDRELAAMMLCLVGATVGFLFWNYPRGLLFAGDGGAYLWGVVIAVACITLVQRHPNVSPWFPMLLLSYPVWETAFSVYRKLAEGTSPGVADALHFHHLIYRRIVRRVFDEDAAQEMLLRNNRTSPYLWGFAMLSVVPAVLFWNETPVLMACCFLFAVLYVGAYLMLVRFKVPKWLRR